MPEAAGLGTHLTLDLEGYARFGPDVEWVDEVDYSVDPSRSSSFYPAIQKYWPGLRDGALKADYAGIRPKVLPFPHSLLWGFSLAPSTIDRGQPVRHMKGAS